MYLALTILATALGDVLGHLLWVALRTLMRKIADTRRKR